MGVVGNYFKMSRDKKSDLSKAAQVIQMSAPGNRKPTMLAVSIRYMFQNGLPPGWGK